MKKSVLGMEVRTALAAWPVQPAPPTMPAEPRAQGPLECGYRVGPAISIAVPGSWLAVKAPTC